MMMKDKKIIITGGGSGIGAAIAKECSRSGAHVAILGRREDALISVADEIKKLGGNVEICSIDISDEDSFIKCLKSYKERWGKIDGLVNNAMSIHGGLIKDLTLEEWRENFTVSLEAAFVGIREVIPYMMAEKKGSIVNISSVVGLRGTSTLGAYAAAKAGLISLTQTAAIEAAPYVRVNCIAPGAVLTEASKAMLNTQELLDSTANSIPLKRIAEPEEMATIARFLLSSDSSFITGECIAADGGKTADLSAGMTGDWE
tara:strand:- start:5388 stop:6164 length:777 start_codon:yes stop_codon:yes gene_type:complete